MQTDRLKDERKERGKEREREIKSRWISLTEMYTPGIVGEMGEGG